LSLSDLLIETALVDMRDRFLAGTLEDYAMVFDPVISSTLVEDTWNTMRAWGKDGFAIEAAFAPVVYKDAHVIVSVVCENTNPHEVFSHAGITRQVSSDPVAYGVMYGGPVEDTIGVYIMAPNRPILRMVDLLIKSTIYSATTWLVENGTSGPSWENTSDLAPVTAMVGTETVLKYVRKQTWKVWSNLVVRPFGGTVVTPKQILVHAAGTFVTKVPDPDTRTYTDLTGTSDGRVTPVLSADD